MYIVDIGNLRPFVLIVKRFISTPAIKNAMKNKKGGIVKKSIFATPDGPGGRVGVGTCGISGRPMTDYVQAEKRKKK